MVVSWNKKERLLRSGGSLSFKSHYKWLSVDDELFHGSFTTLGDDVNKV